MKFDTRTDVTCYTIISRDVKLLDWCVTNARDRAGFDHKWVIVNWINESDGNGHEKIHEWVKGQELLGYDIKYVPYRATEKRYKKVEQPDWPVDFGTERPTPVVDTGWFLENLYACWNLGYSEAKTKYVARMGSDQFFSDNWLRALVECERKHPSGVYHCWTVESDLARSSRHETKQWGHTPDDFDAIRFDSYANSQIHRYNNELGIRGDMCGLYYRHPSRGSQKRPDGVTWLQEKRLWEEFGPLSDEVNGEGVTGDVSYMDKIYDSGVVGYLCPRSISYHLVQGESRDMQNNL
jgi:hypothetical protein